MLRAPLILAFALPVALAAPAPAADLATLGCVEQGLDANARKLLVEDLTANINNAGKAQSYRQETAEALRPVALACKAKHGWSDKATQASLLYTAPKIGWPIGERIARQHGLDPDALARRFRALPETERNDAIDEDVLGKLGQGSFEAGEINDGNAAMAGALYGLLALREKALVDFKAN